MRTILGSCAFSAVVGLIGLPLTADAQTGKTSQSGSAASTVRAVENAVQGNATTPAGTTTTTTAPAATSGDVTTAPVPAAGQPGTTTTTNSLLTAPNNLEQQANERAGRTTVVPGNTATMPGNTYQAPTGPSTVSGNTATGAAANPANTVPGVGNPDAMNSRTYSSNYVPGTQPITTPGSTTMAPGTMGAVGVPGTGYSYVNPMGTTMAPGTYTQGAAIASRPAYWAPSTYTTPGYASPAQSYTTTGYASPYQTYTTPGYASPYQTYPIRQRRGLFGRRTRQVYATGATGYTYGTAPGTYTYTPAPGTYTYAPSPY
jgi:hypothetical protein